MRTTDTSRTATALTPEAARQRVAERAVIILSEQATTRWRVARLLARAGVRSIGVRSALQVSLLLEERAPELGGIIVDLTLEQSNVLQLLRELSERTSLLVAGLACGAPPLLRALALSYGRVSLLLEEHSPGELPVAWHAA